MKLRGALPRTGGPRAMSTSPVLQIATSVATPLSVAGLAIGVLYLLYSQVLQKRLAPLVEDHTFAILNQVLRYVFYLAMTALVLGMGIYATVTVCKETGFCRAGSGESARLESDVQQYLAQGYHRDALKAAERWIELDPRSAKAHRLKGNALYRMQNYSAALLAFDKAIELQPQMPEALFNKGAALIKLGDYPRAEKIFEKLVNQDAADFPSRFNLAETQLLRHEYAPAKANYEIVHKQSADHRAGSALGLGIISVLTDGEANGLPPALRFFGEAICVEPKLRAIFLGIPVEERTQRFDAYLAFLNDLRAKNFPQFRAFVLDVENGKLSCSPPA